MTDRKTWPVALSVGPAAMNPESMNHLASAGIKQAELSSGDIRPFYDVLDFPNKASEIVKMAADNGVNITSVHLPFGPFSKLDPSAADPNVAAYIIEKQSELIGAAAEAGIKIAVIHPSGEPYEDSERAERLERAVSVIAQLTEIAKKAGVKLALENLPRTCLCRVRSEMRYFLDRIPDLNVCYDMNHCLLESNIDYIREVGDRIVTLHISDYDFIDERHLLPGLGKNNWSEIIKTLEEINYSGRFLYELAGGPTYEDVYANYKKLILD